MAKLILLSCIIMMITIPVMASRARSSQRGLRWSIVGVLLFNIVYVFLIRYVYPKLL